MELDNEKQEKLTFDVREAAKILGLGSNTTYGLVQSGRLRAVKVGRRWLIPRRELEAFLTRETENSLS